MLLLKGRASCIVLNSTRGCMDGVGVLKERANNDTNVSSLSVNSCPICTIFRGWMQTLANKLLDFEQMFLSTNFS